MSIKNKKINLISKITTIALISGCIFIGANNQEVYANENKSGISQSHIKSNTRKGKVKPCDFLNVRKGPGVNNSVETKVYTGDIVEVHERNNNGWIKIKTPQGKYGWVNSKYIDESLSNNNASSSQNSKAKKVVELAHKQLGKPYVWGSSGPNSFDCSGLTSYVYKHASNIKLPRTSREQSHVGKTVSKSNLKEGDLVFFSSNGGKSITHVGVYIGNSKMIHSPKPGQKVRIDNINSSYYSRTFYTAKTIL